MPLQVTAATPSDFETLKRQHEAYFPILNEPELLVEYTLSFFGPDGDEPLLSHDEQVKARVLLLARCDIWSRQCAADNKPPRFASGDADYTAFSCPDLALKLAVIVRILEDPDQLLTYVSQAFGPHGPPGLAITDERTWNQLDDLFVCRMPYPTGFPEPCSLSKEPLTGTHRTTRSVHETSDRFQDSQPTFGSLQPSNNPSDAKPSRVQLIESSPLQEPAAATPVIEPEVLQSEACQTTPQKDGSSTLEIVGLCAVCVGVGVVGGLAVVGLGKLLVSPTGRKVAADLGTAAFRSLGQQVFTGPRGGRYVITSNGTKSYNVP